MQIKPKRRKKSFTAQKIQVTVANQPNLDVAIVTAVLKKLGLGTDALIDQFCAQPGQGNLVTVYAAQLHGYDQWYAKQVSIARIQGSVTVYIDVDILIARAILTFLGQTVVPRLPDAREQLASAGKSTVNGNIKGSIEALKDLDAGAGRVAHGALYSLTMPLGSEPYKQGLGDVLDGSVQFGKGLGKMFVQNPLDDLIMFGGGNASALQTLTHFEAVGRALEPGELAILTPIFGSSVEYGAIRIKEGASGFLTIGLDHDLEGSRTYLNNNRALTHGNTIYMKYTPRGKDWDSTLVHETTHVWQNQNGGTDYMTEALYAQAFGEGYEYGDAVLRGKTWFLLNPEQQAQLIEDAFINGYFQNGVWSNAKSIPDNFKHTIPAQNMINYMNQVKPQLMAGQGAT